MIAGFQYKIAGAQADPIPGLESSLAADAVAIDERSIGAPKIGENNRVFLNPNQAMMPADAGYPQPQIAIRTSADQEFRIRDGNFPHLLGSFTPLNETDFHAESPVRTSREARGLLNFFGADLSQSERATEAIFGIVDRACIP